MLSNPPLHPLVGPNNMEKGVSSVCLACVLFSGNTLSQENDPIGKNISISIVIIDTEGCKMSIFYTELTL